MEEKRVRENLLQEGTLLGQRYRIFRCVGIGGFGITYLCEDIEKQRRVAVKEYFPEQWAKREDTYVMIRKSSMIQAFRFGMQSFLDEADMMAELAGISHIVNYYDLFYDNDTVYLVMEYLDGISAGRMLRERGYRPYTPQETAKLLLPMLEGLQQMHGKHIIHRDISPGNIMCTQDGEICLIDLGAARRYTEKKTFLGATLLKPEYAAPEQFRTAKKGFSNEEGSWTDLYAVGAVMFYLLTGSLPPDVLSRAGGKELEKPDGLSEEWMNLIRHCMELQIEDRIQEVTVLTEQMKKLLKNEMQEEKNDLHRNL